MEILGIGPLEAIFIVLIALIAIGPRDLGTAARSLGRSLNRVYRSEAWQSLTQASRNLRGLPNRLAREAALEELDQVRRELKDAPRPPTLPGRAPLAVGREAGPVQPWPVSRQPEVVNSGSSVRPGDGSPVGGKPLPEKTRATKLASGVVRQRSEGSNEPRSSRKSTRGKRASVNKRPRRSGPRNKTAGATKRPRRSGPRKNAARSPKRPSRSGPHKNAARAPRRSPHPSARHGRPS